MPDAVVIGSGPNGLVAANLLVDRGWDVVVLEAQPTPGGAVRSSALIEPGFVNDWMSAFYPLGAVSPVIARLGLERFGLRWRHGPYVLAHPMGDGRCPVISTDVEETAASIGSFGARDAQAWRELYGQWQHLEKALLGALFDPFPPVKAGLRLVTSLPPADLLRFARFAMLPVRRLGEERFDGPGGRLLLAGSALHADLFPESPLSGFFGWLLCALGNSVGFPVPEGGAGNLTRAMVHRFEAKGGKLRCGARVAKVIVRDRRAVGVRLEDGTEVDASRAVVADVVATTLFRDLVGEEHLAPQFVRDLRHFQFDSATFKVDWTLDAPVPWTAEEATKAGTVHIADDVDALTRVSAQLAMGQIPDRPFVLFGQYSCVDPTRQPEGRETAWAYTHVPQRTRGDAAGTLTGDWADQREVEAFADRIEEQVERLAPGFRRIVRGRHIFTPLALEAHDENLVNGAINGGTAQVHQQLVFRPVPGLARPETPIANLYLGSASAHPGGGVHGACGSNAARAAILHDRLRLRR